MTRPAKIEICPHKGKAAKPATVWFLPNRTVILCRVCSGRVVRTARVVVRKARSA